MFLEKECHRHVIKNPVLRFISVAELPMVSLLVRMCDTRNVLIHITAHGVVSRENTMSVAQYAPGRVHPSPCRVDGIAGGDDERDPMVLP